MKVLKKRRPALLDVDDGGKSPSELDVGVGWCRPSLLDVDDGGNSPPSLMSMMVEIGLHSLLLMLVDVGLPSLMVMMVEKGLQSLVIKLGDKGLPLHLAYLRFGGRGQED